MEKEVIFDVIFVSVVTSYLQYKYGVETRQIDWEAETLGIN